MAEINKDELLKKLTPLQYHVTQEKGTERYACNNDIVCATCFFHKRTQSRPFSGCYYKTKETGIYTCVVCDEELFSSDTKYDSGCGWPAFTEVIESSKVKLKQDTSHVGGNLLLLIANPGMVRTEVTCAKCGAHLGHVFDDGPKPARKRFCINSASMQFHPAQSGYSNHPTD